LIDVFFSLNAERLLTSLFFFVYRFDGGVGGDDGGWHGPAPPPTTGSRVTGNSKQNPVRAANKKNPASQKKR